MRHSLVLGLLALIVTMIWMPNGADARAGKKVNIISHERVLTPYKRPSGATTVPQRQSVQGQPCATCGASEGRRIADHKDPLVRQHHRGEIDAGTTRRLDAVQGQCPTCSARQGGQLRAERQRLQKDARENEERVSRGCPGLAWIKNGGKC